MPLLLPLLLEQVLRVWLPLVPLLLALLLFLQGLLLLALLLPLLLLLPPYKPLLGFVRKIEDI